MEIKRLKKNQKLVVYAGSFSVYTTAGIVREGIGCLADFNAAAQKALDALEFMRSGSGAAEQAVSGISGIWEGINIQVDIVAE